ncbi:hypothetical protein BG003_007253 [Podila horticola]|nr:hypothetical protein BG003_007253 [Podila horticola]
MPDVRLEPTGLHRSPLHLCVCTRSRVACRAPRLGRAIKIYSELCQWAHHLNDAITIAIAEARDEAKKDAILKAKEKSLAACAKDACRPFNNCETPPITGDPRPKDQQTAA